jgi:hypothetical protein
VDAATTDPLAAAPYWTELERWVWAETLAGRVADLNARYAASLDPLDDASVWNNPSAPRRLSERFLVDVLTHRDRADAIGRHGLRIAGAWFDGSLALDDIDASCSLVLCRCRFEGNIDLSDARLRKHLSLEGSFVGGRLSLERSRIDQRLLLRSATFADEVVIRYARVGAVLSAYTAAFLADLDMDGITIGDNLFLSGPAIFCGAVSMIAAKIGGQLRAEGSLFAGAVSMDGIDVAQDLLLEQGGVYGGEVALRAGHVRGQLATDGSSFDGVVDMDGLIVDQDVYLRNQTRFGDEVSLVGAKFGGDLIISRSIFSRRLDLRGLEVAQDAYSVETSFDGAVEMAGARVGGDLNAGGATFHASLGMENLQVERLLLLRNGTYEGPILLRGTHVRHQLIAIGSTFVQKVDLEGLDVGRDLSLRSPKPSDSHTTADSGQTEFRGDVVLRGARIGGWLNADHTIFTSTVAMDRIEIGGNLSLRGAHLRGADLIFGRFHTTIDLSGAHVMGEIDLTGADVSGELRLGSEKHSPTVWGADGRLVLRNAELGAIQDGFDRDARNAGWPAPGRLQLDGCTYAHLGGLQGDGPSDMNRRAASWYVDWLATAPNQRDADFSPQPYYHLAKVLREAGAAEKANTVLYAARERERACTTGSAWLGRSVLKVTIGYGLGARYFRALWWVVGFTAIGTLVLLTSGAAARRHGLAWCAWASLDEIIPLVDLNKEYGEFINTTLQGWRLWYFYVHRIVAFVLGSFVAAGLGGITQEP